MIATHKATHKPVMLSEVVHWLAPALDQPGYYVDATVGLGGHAERLLEVAPRARLLGVDKDPYALEQARQRLTRFQDRIQLVQGDHARIGELTDHHCRGDVRAVLFDLGVSSLQLDTPERGFSYMREGPLDMRMSPDSSLTAAQVVNEFDQRELTRIIKVYGEERWAARIACEIVTRRPLKTTFDLVEAVKAAIPPSARRRRPHPAKRTFQAIRIVVNDELVRLEQSIEQAVERLAPGGRLAILSFHSLEDRIVKHTLRELAQDCICPRELPVCRCRGYRILDLLTIKPITPTDQEVQENPRARSAALRVAEKVLGPGRDE